MIRRVVVLTIFALVLIGGLLYSQHRHQPLQVSGFIEADDIRLGSRVGGRVEKVVVDEGDTVKKGQVLVELEPYDLNERRAEAQAHLKQQQENWKKMTAGFRAEETAQAKARYDRWSARLELLKNGPRDQEIAAARSQLELARAELDLAEENHRRTAKLQAEKVATQEQLDLKVRELKVAKARNQAALEQLDLLEEGTRREEIAEAEAQLREAEAAWKLMQNGYREEEIAAAAASMDAAKSALAAIERQLAELKILSPTDGAVESIELEPGDLVAPNAPVLSLIDTGELWVRAYVPENRLRLSLGDRVDISVDSYPGERFLGEVTYIARQAEFTPGNVQTPEERSKQVFRIKVTLREGRDRLRPGMAADVHLESADRQRSERPQEDRR